VVEETPNPRPDKKKVEEEEERRNTAPLRCPVAEGTTPHTTGSQLDERRSTLMNTACPTDHASSTGHSTQLGRNPRVGGEEQGEGAGGPYIGGGFQRQWRVELSKFQREPASVTPGPGLNRIYRRLISTSCNFFFASPSRKNSKVKCA